MKAGKTDGTRLDEGRKTTTYIKASILLRIIFLHWFMHYKLKSPLPVTKVQSIQISVK